MSPKQKTASLSPMEPGKKTAPVADRRPHSVTFHGKEITDEYAWLKDESYPEVDDEDVLDYLKAENAWFEQVMGRHEPLTEKLFAELKARIKEDDASVPAKDGAYLYSWRFDKGAEYRTWLRSPVEGGDEVVLIDEPTRAKDTEFYRLGAFRVSPDHRLAAFSEDMDGSERFTMRVKDLETGALLDDEIQQTLGAPVWASDSSGFAYVLVDENWRPYVARFHVLGTPVEKDVTLYEESDPGFFVGLKRTQSRAFIVISSGDNITTEARLLPADDPASEPVLVAERKQGHEYYLDHAGETLFIRTNDTHPNFRVATAPQDAPGQEGWKELLPPSDERYYTGLMALAGHLVIQERVDGLDQIRVRTHEGEEHHVPFTEPAYATYLGDTREFETDTFRIEYESMVTPLTIYDYSIPERKLTTRKVQEIPSGYDPDGYASERLMATARDGTRVPVTILYKKGFEKNGKGRLHLYGYGAYGYSVDPGFSTSRLSLVDRGFAYAIAHIRGGDEMGRRWYEQGRMFERTNAFTDFVDVARFLVEEGWTSAGNISTSGGSAGGSLMGCVVNSDPELWGAVVAHVPFVDILNTMLDKDLPLTPIEWPIWGNPIESEKAFDYIRSYSPYDNVKAQDYPPILVTAGINDPRVTYWEPAKWVARLRATKTDKNTLLLKTNMEAGHAGKSGRFQRLHETAEEYAFILVTFGLTEEP
jgi:oligopeptidase B